MLEEISGQPWHAVLADMLAPLGMPQTRYGSNSLVAKGMTEGYSRAANGQWLRAPFLSTTQTHAAGGLLSCVDDMLIWSRALHGGQLLRPETYERMCRPEAPCTEMGLGIKVSTVRGECVLGHEGSVPGFLSAHLYMPRERLTVIVLQNTDAEDVPDTLARKLMAVILGRPYPEAATVPISSEDLLAIAGTFRSPTDHSDQVCISFWFRPLTSAEMDWKQIPMSVVDGHLRSPDGRALRHIGCGIFVLVPEWSLISLPRHRRLCACF